MSNTIKDMPYTIQAYYYSNKRPPSNWVERNRDWRNKTKEEEEIRDHFWHTYGWMRGCGRYAKEENRKHRTKCKQLIREGEYEMPRYRHNASWLAW